jgi:hypothetical protein
MAAARPRRVVDRGAITAAWVGVGMAVTIGVSFLLVIPIEPIYWYLALPAGLMIGYYANARSRREGGPWLRVLANGLLAGLATGITFALLLLAVKALFAADNGYRDQGASLTCQTGADCVYQRYLAVGQGDALAAAGVTDVESFTALYWREQLSTATLVFTLATLGGLGGALLYGLTNRRRADDRGSAGAQPG